MRKYLVFAAMGLAACGSDKKTSKVGGGTVETTPGTASNDPNNGVTPVNPNDASNLTGPEISTMGRFVQANGGSTMAWAGSRVMSRVEGTNTVSIGLKTSSPYNAGKVTFSVMIDDQPANPAFITLDNTQTITSFTVNLPDNNAHVVKWTKISEPAYGLAVLTGVTPGAGGTLTKTTLANRHIEFIGDSIVNGYGVLGANPCNGNSTNSSSDESFATLTAKALSADYTLIAFSGRGLATNLDGTMSTTHDAGDANNTQDVVPAMFLDAIPPSSSTPTAQAWDPSLLPVDVVVINLGTNDFSAATKAYVAAGGTASACTPTTGCNPVEAKFVAAYVSFLGKVRTAYPNAYIVATTGPMLSDNYPGTAVQHTTAAKFINEAVTQFADTKVQFYDFGIQPTDGVVLACDSHPNAAEHLAMASGGTDATGKAQVGLVTFIKTMTGWN